jgi:competence protein ComEA
MISTRLTKNIISFIIVLLIITFFCIYKPSTEKKIISQNSPKNSIKKTENINESVNFTHKINPNIATFDELKSIGFSSKQAYNCLNFVKSGGVFKKSEDIKKLYTISKSDFERIIPYISIPITIKKISNSTVAEISPKQIKTISTINLNTSDTTILKSLPKIGSFRAKKIVEYREKLGGFYSYNQLYKIYSFDSTVVNTIQKYCRIDTSEIQKININTVTFKVLENHPLISYYQAKDILNYKKIVGTIGNIKELADNNIINKTDYEILKYYIKTF